MRIRFITEFLQTVNIKRTTQSRFFLFALDINEKKKSKISKLQINHTKKRKKLNIPNTNAVSFVNLGLVSTNNEK